MPLTPVKNCELLIGDLFKIRFLFDGYETILIVRYPSKRKNFSKKKHENRIVI